ncbi:hypothetical protein C5167_006408 [Papaver somniferum]|uniref:Uncharacterized protein n=1 Tax=Papaver somniferum TaxID=3469 RepID=A0A4Y7JH24_PAPSO|nr:uncharacterized protein LOC113276391 [Papaver somniferum]RZC59108.1 hypothetical protein C5167_006408 [Papaver somniferum]
MGNCQAVDTATLVIQHPGGKVERWYWPILAREIMKTNPGHYVALIITLCVPQQQQQQQQESKKKQESQTMVVENRRVRITRVKILRPNDTLALGQAYRLISSEDVMKGVWAKKYAKMKKKDLELMMSTDKPIQLCQKQSSLGCHNRKEQKITAQPPEMMLNQGPKLERHRQRFTHSTSGRLRTWRPSLQSISEQAGS